MCLCTYGYIQLMILIYVKDYHSIQFILACQENFVLLALSFYRLKNLSSRYSSEVIHIFRLRVLKMTVERTASFPGSILLTITNIYSLYLTATRCPMFTADCKLDVESQSFLVLHKIVGIT